MNKKNSHAIVVTLKDDISEIIELANSLDYSVIESFFQRRKKPDVNTYIGKGKVDEIKNFIEESDKEIDLVIFDGELKPSQWFILEKIFNVDVYDRIRLILAIFEQRAERKEARLQVKLAQLQYERPFVRELIHRARSGEHPGFMAGGEYQVDDYYEMIKKQVKKIKEELDSIRDNRELSRQHRHGSGYYLISLAGYTNAGKSSLLSLLSGEKVKIEGKLFSTLSTTTRKIENKNIPILLTDTVGFIQDLPAIIIDAFHSTLEEIELADLVLLVADISEDQEIVAMKLKTSIDELVEIGSTSPIILVFNKIDLISENELSKKIDYLEEKELLKNRRTVFISVKNEKKIEKLNEVIYNNLPKLVKFRIKLPINEKTLSFVSWIYNKANVYDVSYGDYVSLSIESNIKIRDKIISKCHLYNGYINY